MIVTVSEVKSLLQIVDSSKDTFIASMIPIVQDFVFTYTNNYFEILTDKVYRESNSISFVNGSPSKINDSQNKFISAGFVPGIHTRVQGSKFNDGVYKVAAVEAGSLILSAEEELTNESVDSEVVTLITVVKFPKGIKLPVAKLIGFHLDPKNAKGVQSESLGDHSISFQSGGNYPQSLLNDLIPYRRMITLGDSKKRMYSITNKR
ncbi:MAG: phage head-tail connector protein [Bacteroidota bacterium]|jgi:hypothetical protein